jgi:hypothetical protein
MSQSRLRRAARAVDRQLGWAVGMPLATLRFLIRRTPVEDREVRHRPDRPDGEPTVRRRYRVRVERPRLSPGQLAAIVVADPNVVLPVEVIRFEHRDGGPEPLRAGQRRMIHMAGPWNGPVRVLAAGEEGFRLAGLKGGAQRGEVAYRVTGDDEAIDLEVGITQRSASRLYDLVYHRLGLARRIERHTWSHVLERSAQLAGGRPPERVIVETLVSDRPRGPVRDRRRRLGRVLHWRT